MRKITSLFALLLLFVVSAKATDVTVIASGSDASTYGTVSGTTFTTNAASGLADVTVTGFTGTTATTFAYGACLAFQSTSSGTITLSAPTGYKIAGYKLTARSNTYSVPYTLTPSEGGSAVSTTTSGVELTASGLEASSTTISYSAASANSFYIPSLVVTVVDEAAIVVDVTYALYDSSDPTTLISSVVVTQEANSAINVPSSLQNTAFYDYTTSGTIGDTDCTITVTRTGKEGFILKVGDLSNYKVYTISTYDRGSFYVPADSTQVTGTTKANVSVDPTSTTQQFAFIEYESNYYLYSVSESKFISKSDRYTTLTAQPGDNVTLLASSGSTTHPVVVALQDGAYQMGVSNGYTPAVITFWNDVSDGGNRVLLTPVDDFDPTAALQALENYFHPSYFVTYVVKDTEGNTLFTSDAEATTLGANITTLPSEYQRSAFYTYNTVDVTIADANTTVEFTATPRTDAPIQFTEDATNPYYYNLNIRSKYLVYDDTATGEVTLQDTSEPFNTNAAWAFVGNPYDGFNIVNQAKGTDYYLTYTSVVTGGNNGSDGSNNNIQFLSTSEAAGKVWLCETNTGGFCLRMKENTNIYFHHQNISGSNGYLRTCSVSEWSAVHNDAGSTIVASTDEQVLVDLYNSMKDMSFGDAIGQYYSTNTTVATDAEAASTISNVGAAISASATSAYASCYTALTTLATIVAQHTPAAGFYRLKNVATGKYLTAIAANGYAGEAGVFANGDATSAATVIELREGSDGLYMYNQSYGFGWVEAQKTVGSGNAWVTATPDKYVNWLTSTAPGQIAFSIAYGNGTGSYAAYLTRGIYTANEEEAVVGGEDATADAAQWIFEEATEVALTLNDGGDGNYYATMAVPFDVTLNGTTAYTATLSEDKTRVSFTELGTSVPAGTAVLLKGANATATATITSGLSEATSDLVANYFSTTLSDTQLALGKSGDEVGFYQYTDALGANKAYLDVTGSSARAFAIVFDDEVTGINAVNAGIASGAAVYDLQGRRVSNAQKGIYIVNGKKVLVK